MGYIDTARQQWAQVLAPARKKFGPGSMPDRLIKIGELSELLKITTRAIRHYEERGLVDARDRTSNGERLFDESARRRLEWIAKLRVTGIGLRDIEEILAAGEHGSGRGAQLRLAIGKLDARAASLKAQVLKIEAVIELMRGALDEGAMAD